MRRITKREFGLDYGRPSGLTSGYAVIPEQFGRGHFLRYCHVSANCASARSHPETLPKMIGVA